MNDRTAVVFSRALPGLAAVLVLGACVVDPMLDQEITQGLSMRIVLNVRSTPEASDTTGDGSSGAPYRTIRKAVSAIPLDLIGTRYVIDCTGLGLEEVPFEGLSLPPIRSADGLVRVDDPVEHPAFEYEGAVTIRATPAVVEQIAASEVAAYYRDPINSLRTITITGRNWAPDQWKGKLLFGATRGQIAVVAGNTATTLQTTYPGELTPPIQIAAPSCELRNSNATSARPTLAVRGMTGSLVFAGLRLSHANGFIPALQLNSEIVGRYHSCDIDAISVVGGGAPPLFVGTRIQGGAPLPPWPPIGSGRRMTRAVSAYSFANSLIQDVAFATSGGGSGFATISTSIVDGCAYLGENPNEGYDGAWLIKDAYIKNARTDGFHAGGGSPHWLKRVRIDGSVGDAVNAYGAGPVVLQRVVGTGSQGHGIRARNGAQVSVDLRSTVAGVLGDLRVGSRATRSFFHFRSEPVALNEVDLAPGTGDASRVWQDGATCCGVWSQRSAGDSHEFASMHSVRVDGAGDVVFVGRTASSTLSFPGGAAMPSLGSYDGFVTKLSSTGAPRWSRRVGGGAIDMAHAIAVDAADNVIVAGAYTGAVNMGGAPLPVAGNYEAFVLKLDRQGNHVWSTGLATAGADHAYGVTVDAAGDVFVIGAIDWNPYSAAGDGNITLSKLSGASGAVVWSKTFVTSGGDAGFDVATDAAGNPFIVGVFGNPSGGSIDLGGTTLSSTGVRKGFVAKLDGGNGAHIWSRAVENSTHSDLNAVEVSGAAVFVGGASRGAATLAGGPPVSVGGEYDFFVARLAAGDGAHVWSRSFGGSGQEDCQDLAVDGAGDLIATGRLGSAAVNPGGGPLPYALASDVVVARYAGATGVHVASASFGDSGDEVGYGVAVRVATGNVHLVGHTSGALDFGEANLADPLAQFGYFVANVGQLNPP